MATKSNFKAEEIQRLEMLRIMTLNQLDFLDKALDKLTSDGFNQQTDEEFNSLTTQIIRFQQHLNLATDVIM